MHKTIKIRLAGLCILAAIIMLHGCKGGSTGDSADHRDSLTMEESDMLLVPLDSSTTQVTSYMQLIDDSVLAFFNEPNYDIVLNNLNNGTATKVTIHRDGPDAVNGVTGFCYVSPDSIWLYEQWGRDITLIDSNGNKKGHVRMSAINDSLGNRLKYAVSPYPLTISPYTVKNGIHYLQGMNGRAVEGQIPGSTLIYDEKAGNWKTENAYPSVYGANDEISEWNPFGFRQTQYTFTPDGEMLINYPASDSLYTYNPMTGEHRTYNAAYSKPTNIHLVKVNSLEESYADYLKQYCYTSIHYDKFNDVYYRIIRTPIEDFDITKYRELLQTKPVVIIILNKDFKNIGEYSLPDDKYNHGNIFINKNGLHINVVSDDDDFMKFRVFRIKE